jgi:predicted Zn-dependent protease
MKTVETVVLLTLAAASGCAAVDNDLRKTETAAAEVLISPDQENSLGLQVKNDLEQNQHVKYLNDPAVNIYVRGVADKVIAFGKQARPEVNWQVNVIDDPKTVNAFATPGGYLYVYSGLLMAADNEAELAGVMAHETGHVVARHSARQMVAQYGLDAITNLALGKNPGLAGQIASGIVTQGTLLAHSRADENEADEYGAKYSSQAGYDPHGLVSFFSKLQAQGGSTPRVLTYLSDHPATPDRITHVNDVIARNGLGGTDLGAARFAPIKQRLGGSVAATPAPRPAGGYAPPPN